MSRQLSRAEREFQEQEAAREAEAARKAETKEISELLGQMLLNQEALTERIHGLSQQVAQQQETEVHTLKILNQVSKLLHVIARGTLPPS